ncbi:hypothetical protein ACEQ8H_008153 [Pleosporales sp. CAS-2024a]
MGSTTENVAGNHGILLFPPKLLFEAEDVFEDDVQQGQTCSQVVQATQVPGDTRASREGLDGKCHNALRRTTVSLLTSIDSKNIIAASDRRHRSRQSKLMYDAKYHPMDDCIRPSLAAKRRSLHGETLVIADDDDDETDTSDAHGVSDEIEHEAGWQMQRGPTKSNKKRIRCASQSPQPFRRSSRTKSTPRISYDTSIHPQDPELEQLMADDNNYANNGAPVKLPGLPCPYKFTVVSLPAFGVSAEDETCSEHSEIMEVAQISNEGEMSTTGSSTSAPQPPGPQRTGKPSVWNCCHEQGTPFNIYTEPLEDQLAAEASAASPYTFDHDDKENEIGNGGVGGEVDAAPTVSVVPLSRHSRSNEDPVLSEAFYATSFDDVSPYGLGGDGTLEQTDMLLSEAMGILASGDKLPCEVAAASWKRISSMSVRR